jgi:hypothetical protein
MALSFERRRGEEMSGGAVKNLNKRGEVFFIYMYPLLGGLSFFFVSGWWRLPFDFAGLNPDDYLELGLATAPTLAYI